MAVNDVAGELVYHVWDILREFLGHDFVCGLRTMNLKTFKNLKKNYKKTKNLKTFSKNLVF